MPKIELTDDEIMLLREAIELDIDHTMSDAKANSMRKFDRAKRLDRIDEKLRSLPRINEGLREMLSYGNAEIAAKIYSTMDT